MNMTNPVNSKNQYRLAYLIMVALVVFFGSKISQNPVSFNHDLQERVLDLLTNLGVIVFVMERALEIYVSIWRGKDKILLEEEINRIEAKVAFTRENNKKEIQASQFEVLNNKLSDARQTLEVYRDETRTITLRFTLIIGIIISISGFRVLDALFIKDALTGLQLKIYDWTDILLTAGVLSGGSAGIHSLSNTLGTFFDETTKKLKKSGN